MSGTKKLSSLQEKKQLLLLASDAQRAALLAEWSAMQVRSGWADQAYLFWKNYRPILMLAAPLSGYLLARIRKRRDQPRSKWGWLFQLFRSALQLLRFLR